MNKERTKWDYVKSIDSMIQKYVYHVPETTHMSLHKEFCHNIDPDKIPLQGWKIHVSVNDLQDYEKVLTKLLPRLEEQGIQYKVINPQFLERQLSSNQQGKAITIYPTPGCDLNKLFSANPLSPTHQLLNQQAVAINNEIQLMGRVFARYGALRGVTSDLLSPDGIRIGDTRWQSAAPSFVEVQPSVSAISNFYSAASLRYGQTRNHKDYVEEMLLGTHTYGCSQNPDWDSRRHNFITIQLNHEDYDKIKNIVEAQHGFSCMFKMQGAEYGIIHNDDAQSIFQALTEQGIPYNRPGWDISYNISVIEPGKEQEMLQAIAAMYQNKPVYQGTPQMQTLTLPNGMMAIQYETNQDKEFTEICQWKQIATYDMVLGKNIGQIQQNWQQVVDHTIYTLNQQTHTQNYEQQVNANQSFNLNEKEYYHSR